MNHSKIESKLLLCKFFRKGECLQGDACIRAHSRAEQQDARKQVGARAVQIREPDREKNRARQLKELEERMEFLILGKETAVKCEEPASAAIVGDPPRARSDDTRAAAEPPRARSDASRAAAEPPRVLSDDTRAVAKPPMARSDDIGAARSPCPVPVIDIRALIQECASGGIVLQMSSWADMADDFSDDEQPGVNHASAFFEATSCTQAKKERKQTRKRAGSWADMSDASSDEDTDTAADARQ